MKALFILFAGLLLSCSNSEKTEQLQQELNQLKTEQKNHMDAGTKNKTSVRAFFKALEDEDAEAIANLFAENATHINPYHSGIFPQGADGREAIRKYWTPVFPNFDGMQFPIETMYAMEDPRMVFVKYTGNIKLKDGAGTYSNQYYSTFKFDDSGKIVEYVEIFNPITAARAFGLLDNIK